MVHLNFHPEGMKGWDLKTHKYKASLAAQGRKLEYGKGQGLERAGSKAGSRHQQGNKAPGEGGDGSQGPAGLSPPTSIFLLLRPEACEWTLGVSN